MAGAVFCLPHARVVADVESRRHLRFGKHPPILTTNRRGRNFLGRAAKSARWESASNIRRLGHFPALFFVSSHAEMYRSGVFALKSNCPFAQIPIRMELQVILNAPTSRHGAVLQEIRTTPETATIRKTPRPATDSGVGECCQK